MCNFHPKKKKKCVKLSCFIFHKEKENYKKKKKIIKSVKKPSFYI